MLKKEKKGFDWSKVYTGGDLGAGYNGSMFLLNISPMFGYQLTKRYSAGLGITYLYVNDKVQKYKTSIYGLSVFNRLNLADFLFLHGEYMWLNGPFDYFLGRSWYQNLWVGAGLKQGVGNSYVSLMALWNLGPDESPLFPSPWIRGGISIGF